MSNPLRGGASSPQKGTRGRAKPHMKSLRSLFTMVYEISNFNESRMSHPRIFLIELQNFHKIFFGEHVWPYI